MISKVPFLAKVGNYISMLGYAYQMGGFKTMFTYMSINAKSTAFIFLFRHCKWYRNKILKNNINLGNISFFILMDMIYSQGIVDIKKYSQYLNDEDKAKFREQMLECKKSMMENGNITDEEQIANIDEMLGIE